MSFLNSFKTINQSVNVRSPFKVNFTNTGMGAVS